MKRMLLASSLLLSGSALAINVNVTSTCGGGLPPTVCDAFDSEINSYVQGDLPDVSLGKYGSGLANAQGFAYKGNSSDYSDEFDYFMVSAGGGAAFQGDQDDPEGVGFGAAATVGLNLDLVPVEKIGPVELSKLDVFLSFMSYSPDQEINDGSFKGDLSHFGVMARYQIIEGTDWVPGNLLRWGGLFLHTGLQRSSTKATFTQNIDDQTITLDSSQQARVTNTSATFDFETTNMNIPIEVSTYIRAGWILSFFGGAGFDLVSGSTDVSLNASGTASSTSVSGYSATISADESSSGDADATNFRAFIGGQFNLPFFRIYAQANKGLGNDLLGVNLGAKILW